MVSWVLIYFNNLPCEAKAKRYIVLYLMIENWKNIRNKPVALFTGLLEPKTI